MNHIFIAFIITLCEPKRPPKKRQADFGNLAKRTRNKAEVTKHNQLKPVQTETPAKNLEADFSDSTKPTRSYASAESAANEKNEDLKTCLLKNGSLNF